MLDLADMQLVREYADSGSEEAFRTLVSRHINLVYSVALRRLGNPHQAEEICQAVFIILARKAASLLNRTVLSGWLYETTRLTAANFLRSEVRRVHREQEAQMQSTSETAEPDVWARIAPMLEEAMAHLNHQDRNAVVLRFFETRSFQEVGGLLGTSEAAAKMRVNRALEKLRKFFLRRGIPLSTAAICSAVTAQSVQAAPIGLAASISAAALQESAGTASTLALIKSTLKIMAWTKAKTTLVIGAGILLVAGTTTVSVKHIVESRTYPWQVRNLSSDLLNRLPPQVHILPSKFLQPPTWVMHDDKVLGISHPLQSVLLLAYGESNPSRMVSSVSLPEGRYDFIANLPQNSREALQQELKRKFGLSATHKARETEVLRLTVKHAGADGLRPSDSQNGSASSGRGQFSCVNQPLSCLTSTLEDQFNLPVVDETGLTGRYDIDLSWDQTTDGLKQVLLEELGLELTSGNQPMEMLIVQQSR